MKLFSLLFFRIFTALILLVPSLSWAMDSQVPDDANYEGESCTSVRDYRKQTCDKAAKICILVHRLDAFNQIRPCAHYAQECSQAGDKESVVCNPESDSRITALPLKKTSHSNAGKPL